ncbi:Retrovirus-related Pol polyprotein from transposon TNT 1-94, partial [Anthophora retusa]
MKSILVYNDLWSYVDGSEARTETNTQEWDKKDSKALALINLSITHGQLNHVKKAKTSKDAWNTLKEVFESRGPVRKTALYKQLIRMEKKRDMSMTQYVNEFSSKAEQLEEVGIKLPEEVLSIMLLSSLPPEYENFSVVIESRDEVPSLENLQIKLKEEEARQSDRNERCNENENKSDALLTKNSVNREKHMKVNSKYYNNNNSDNRYNNYKKRGPFKYTIKCFSCGRMGHKSVECRTKYKRNETNNVNDTMITIASNTEPVKRSGTWCIDSGATRHMCNDEQKFETLKDSERSKVFTAAEHYVKSTGTGEIKLNAKINRHVKNSVKLKDTMCVPELRNNLLSVACVTNNGYNVTFEKDRAVITRKDGSVALTATKRNNLYLVDEIEESTMLANGVNNNLSKWHQRYGHLNVHDLKRMKNQNMVKGMDLGEKVDEINCTVCARCKINVQPFKPSHNREKRILGLVHSDICGPMRIESLGGARYFVTFIDDSSRYIETAMLRNRSDVLEAFKNYKRKVENYTGRRIKVLRTDNGKEYVSNAFKNFLKEEGISRQLSVEYAPQQNGIAERANRTLVEMARYARRNRLVEDYWKQSNCSKQKQ